MSKIFAIQGLMEESTLLIKSKASSIYSKEPMELLFIQPYIQIQNLTDSGAIRHFTASKRLKI